MATRDLSKDPKCNVRHGCDDLLSCPHIYRSSVELSTSLCVLSVGMYSSVQEIVAMLMDKTDDM